MNLLAQVITQSYHGQTTLHPVGLASLIVLAAAMFALPRRYALMPLIVLICFIPGAQRIVVAGLDFTLIRLLILTGLARVTVRAEWSGTRPLPLDLVVIAWAAAGTGVFVVQQGTFGALLFRLGNCIDTVGAYFLCRALVRSIEDIKLAVRTTAWIALPVGAFFVFEHFTRHNLFGVFGGVSMVTPIRDGRLRCTGAFSHPILAGCFWAALLPLFTASAVAARRLLCVETIGAAASVMIVMACASSTPLMAVIFGVVAATFYPLRWWMGYVQVFFVALVVCLHMVMKAPVWSLLGRIHVVGGSTGYHRFLLVDAGIRRFDEWWLWGTTSTAHWGRGLYDVTNQYLLEGVRGGALTLVLFLACIWLAFAYVGRAGRVARTGPRSVLAWGLGVALFVHCTNFIGVSYFGQIIVLWHLMLAFAAAAYAETLAPARPAERQGALGALPFAAAQPAALRARGPVILRGNRPG